MPKSGGISGVALTVGAAGAFFVYAGIRNVSPLDGLRQLLRGQVPTGKPPVIAELPGALEFARADAAGAALFGSAAAGSVGAGGNARVAEAAKKYLGTPYVWGGHAPGGFDCSGLVTWVLVHDIGLTNLPNSTHTTTLPFMGWSGAQTINRSDMAAGDLVCWAGHIGIAVDGTNMVHAPDVGQVVKIGRVWNVPAPIIRRIRMPSPSVPAGLGISSMRAV